MRSGGDPHARGRDNPTWRLERWKHELASRMRHGISGGDCNAPPHARAGEFSRRIPLFFRAFPAIMAV